MHRGNSEFLDYLRQVCPHAFYGKARVVEIGALDINGSVRAWFKYAGFYLGIDKVPGPGVDLVADVTDADLGQDFNVVVCFSVLEHTPHWRKILDRAHAWLIPGGLLFLSWGAEGNKHHAPEPWAPVPHADVVEHLEHLHFEVYEAFFENVRFTGDCEGCYDVAARKRE